MIDTKRKFVARLRKHGFTKDAMTMTRGTTTYSGHGVTICVAHESFIATDRVDSSLTCIPNAMHIGNVADGARSKVKDIVLRAVDAGLCESGPVSHFDIGVCIARLAEFRASFDNPTDSQLLALRTYRKACKAKHSDLHWQACLSVDWQRGGTQLVDVDTYTALHQLRNTHGPKWLAIYRLLPGIVKDASPLN